MPKLPTHFGSIVTYIEKPIKPFMTRYKTYRKSISERVEKHTFTRVYKKYIYIFCSKFEIFEFGHVVIWLGSVTLK